MAFIVMSVMTALIYTNFNTTLGVFLRDEHNIPEIGYGYLISMNAIIVVLFQFWVARKLGKIQTHVNGGTRHSSCMGLGFAMYGFTSTYHDVCSSHDRYHDRRNGRQSIPAGVGGKLCA